MNYKLSSAFILLVVLQLSHGIALPEEGTTLKNDLPGGTAVNPTEKAVGNLTEKASGNSTAPDMRAAEGTETTTEHGFLTKVKEGFENIGCKIGVSSCQKSDGEKAEGEKETTKKERTQATTLSQEEKDTGNSTTTPRSS